MGDEKKTPSWEEVKKVLDNPDVSDDLKQKLAVSYASSDSMGWFRTNPEARPYLDKYDDGYGATVKDAFSGKEPEDRLNDAYKAAKDEADKAATKDRQHGEDVKKGRDALADSRRKGESGSHGGAGAATADELLNSGKPGLAYFRNWVPLYKKIDHAYNDRSKVPDLKALEERYGEQTGLNFDKFAKSVEDLRNAEKGLRGAHQTMSDKLAGLWKTWTGPAAQSAQQFFAGKFTPTAQDRVISTTGDAAGKTEETIKAVAEMVRHKAETALKLDEHSKTLAGKAAQDWDTTIKVANRTDDDKTMREACTIWGVQIDEDCGDLTEDAKKKIFDTCFDQVKQYFAAPVENQCVDFVKLCDDTKKNIDDAFSKLNDELNKAEENPFAHPGGKQDGGDKGKQGGGGQHGGGGASGGGVGSGGGAGGGAGAGGGGMPGGGGAGGGGGIPGAGAGGVPEVPETPQVPGMHPGGPGAAQPAPSDKVTLGAGEDAVSVHQPGPDGKTQVEVVGPDGKPKSYQVDFGGHGPGQPGNLPPAAPAGMPPQVDAEGQGGVPAPGGGPGGIPVQAGEDGKAVIHEGDRTISLQRTPDGQIQVDVDNGHGQQPLHQTLDFAGADRNVHAPIGEGEPPGGQRPGTTPTAPGSSLQTGFRMDPAAAAPGHGPGMGAGGQPSEAPQPAAAAAGGPAPTVPQAAGFGSFGGAADGVQNSFGSASGQLLGFGDHGPGQPDHPGGPGVPDQGGGHPAASGGAGHAAQAGAHAGQPAGHPGAAGAPLPPGGSSGIGSMSEAASGSPQGASGLQSMGGAQQNPGASQGGMMGGGMMGGMGGMGGHGQQGGEQERTNSSPWRTQGQLFDDGIDASKVRFRSVLGEDTKK